MALKNRGEAHDRIAHTNLERGKGTPPDGVRDIGKALPSPAIRPRETRMTADLNALTRIHALSGRLLEKEGLQPLLQETMEAAVEIVEAQLGTLQLLEGESLRIVAHHGHQKPFLDFFESAESRASVCGEATRRGERVIVPDVEKSSLFANTPSLHVLRSAGVRAVQSTPMRSRTGALLGILTTQWRTPYSPDEHDLWRLDLLVRQAADLIEHVRAEEEIRRSERKYRQLFESMIEGFLLVEPIFNDSGQPVSYRYLESNPALADLTGLKLEDIIGKDAREILPHIEPYWIETFCRVAATGKPERIEQFSSDLNSWYDVYIYRPESGKAALVYTNSTERKQSELALKKSEATLRMAERASRAGSWDWEILSGKLQWTPELFELFGLDPASENASFETWRRILHPDDEPGASGKIEAALKEHSVLASEYRIVLPDGTVRWIYSGGEGIYNEAGAPVRMLGICLDITAQKRAEVELKESRNKYQALIETTNDFIWETDANGRYTYCSPQMEKLWGIKPEEMIGKTQLDLVPIEHRNNAMESFLKLAESPQPFSGMESAALIGQGRLIDIETSGVPFFDEGGKLLGFRGISRDITDRKRAEDALRDSEEALRQANAELEARVQERTAELIQRAAQLRALAGELTLAEQREKRRLARVLHDHLQQLLVGAKFRLTVLSRGSDDVMKQAIQEIEGLLDESIASSRSLTAELSPPILHEAGLIAGLEWLVRRMADTQGLFIDLNAEQIDSLPDDLTILVFESVRELLFNVVKHAQARSACVSVRRIHESLQLTVSDQGSGFDPMNLPRVGEAGGGFGLFGIRERLQLFGGTMEIQSAPGQGTRLIISVPITQAAGIESKSEADAVSLTKPPAEGRISAPIPGKKIRLLLADDHIVVRQGIANLLSEEPDIEIVGSAANGQEAVELAQELLPDVILMDMNMPKLNGIEATRILHNEFPDIRVIGLSMFEEVDRSQAMRDAGAISYVTKSGPVEELVNAIRTSIRSLQKPSPAKIPS